MSRSAWWAVFNFLSLIVLPYVAALVVCGVVGVQNPYALALLGILGSPVSWLVRIPALEGLLLIPAPPLNLVPSFMGALLTLGISLSL